MIRQWWFSSRNFAGWWSAKNVRCMNNDPHLHLLTTMLSLQHFRQWILSVHCLNVIIKITKSIQYFWFVSYENWHHSLVHLSKYKKEIISANFKNDYNTLLEIVFIIYGPPICVKISYVVYHTHEIKDRTLLCEVWGKTLEYIETVKH